MVAFGALVVAVVMVAAEPSGCAGLPEPTVPLGLGVNIHFTQFGPGEAARFAEAGYGLARMDLTWGRVEREKGRYDFSDYDRLTNELEQLGVRPLYILDYANRHYDGGVAPHTEEGRAAFARFAAAAAKRFHGRGVIWEIWNEPNLDGFWKPKASAEDYAKLALATVRAMRAADPDAVIVAPGSSGFPWAFFETMFAAGLLEHIDGVSVHPYRPNMPETAAADYVRLRGLIARYASPEKRMLPILSSEWGYSTREGGDISETKQAQYIVREWLSNMASGVNVSIFYDWKDDGPDPRENEHRFGTVRQDLTPKPSFESAKALIGALRGYTYRHRLVGKTDRHWKLLFQKGDSDEIAVVEWIADPAASDADQMPRVSRIASDSPEFLPLRRLAAVRWPAGPLAESAEAPAALLVEVAPLGGKPATVALRGLEGSGAFHVPAESAVSRVLSLPIGPQGFASRVLDPKLAWNDEALPAVDPIAVVRWDAVSIQVAPRGESLVLAILNPTRRAFQATFEVADATRTRATAGVAIAKGTERGEVALPRPSGVLTVRIKEGDRPAEALLKARFEPLRPFPAHFQYTLFVENHGQAPRPLDPTAEGLAVPYVFDKGWRYATITPARENAIPDGAQALVLWVEADGSGDALRSRIRDRTGQTFQVDLGRLEWKGWRAVTIDLERLDVSSHWGGVNDGVPHPPLAWEGLLLIDSAHRESRHEGNVRLASPFYLFER